MLGEGGGAQTKKKQYSTHFLDIIFNQYKAV